jgi:hypothetical protein
MPTIITAQSVLFRNPTNSQTLTLPPSKRQVNVPEWVINDPTYKAHLAAGSIQNVTPAETTTSTPVSTDTDATAALENAKEQIDQVIENAEAAAKSKTQKTGK